MRILITGASGLLGFNLAFNASRSHTVIGADRGKLYEPPFQVVRQDLLEPRAAAHLIETAKPDTIVHCAAAANVDFCEREPEIASRLNADVPAAIAAECASRGIRLLHISTDAVFDGRTDRPYTEDDSPDPQSVYAETKLAGERAVLAQNPEAVVLRVNFYGWSLEGWRSLAEFFVNNLSNHRAVKGFTDVIFCPMFVRDLSEVLVRIAATGLRGLYHAVGPEAMSKYDFGLAVARRFGLETALISPASVDDSGLAAPRAHTLNLSNGKLSRDLGSVSPDFSTGLEGFHGEFQQGYPQDIRRYLSTGARAELGSRALRRNQAGPGEGRWTSE